MNFDRIAPFYDAMETWIAGRGLHRARTAFLDEIPQPVEALLVGEGHGRFLLPFREKFPETRITVIDGSAKMLEIAKTKLGDAGGVTFVHALIGDWEASPRFDLIVTNFMLDCLDERGVREAVAKLSSLAADDADWLIADFQIPAGGAVKWRSKVIVSLLYGFFRIVTRIPAKRLVSADEFLENAGFQLIARSDWDWRLLKSEWWRRQVSPP